MNGIEFGVSSLTDHVRVTADGRAVSARERVDELIRLGVRAEEVGLDGFAVGEHHSPDFAVSSPAVLLAAIGAQTSRIRLGTAVTVLSALDPVRVYEDFATLDQVSGGRAEITVGRGAFIEPFEIFGVPVDQYDAVFEEKLDLLLRLTREEEVTWHGRFRTPLAAAQIAPRAVQAVLPVWVGVAGTGASAQRAGRLGLPMIIGSLGTPLPDVVRLAEIYREAGSRAGHPERLRLGFGAHVHITDSEREARDVFPYYRDFLAPKRPGSPGPTVTQEYFDAGFHPQSTRYIGSESQVRDKLIALHRAIRFDRFQALVGWGGLPADATDRTLRLLADSIAPALRELP